MFFPKTFARFKTVWQYQDLTTLDKKPLAYALLRRGDPKSPMELQYDCLVGDVGAPRYAKY